MITGKDMGSFTRVERRGQKFYTKGAGRRGRSMKREK